MEKNTNQSQQGKHGMDEVDKMFAFRHPTVHKDEHMAHHQDGRKGKITLPHDAETGHVLHSHGENM